MKGRNIILIYKSFFHSDNVRFVENLLDHIVKILLKNENDGIFLICDNDLLSFTNIKNPRFKLIRRSNKLENFALAIDKFKIDFGLILNFDDEVLNFAKSIKESTKIKLINDLNITSILREFKKFSKSKNINKNLEWIKIKTKHSLINFQKKNRFFPIQIDLDGKEYLVKNQEDLTALLNNFDPKINLKVRNKINNLKWYISSALTDKNSSLQVLSESLLIPNAVKIDEKDANLLLINRFIQNSKELEKFTNFIVSFNKIAKIRNAIFSVEYAFYEDKMFIRNFKFGLVPRNILSSNLTIPALLRTLILIFAENTIEEILKNTTEKFPPSDINFLLFERQDPLLFVDTSVSGVLNQARIFINDKNQNKKTEDQVGHLERYFSSEKIVEIRKRESEYIKQYDNFLISEEFCNNNEIMVSDINGHFLIRNTESFLQDYALLFKLSIQEASDYNIIGFTPYFCDILNIINYDLKLVGYKNLTNDNIESINSLFKIKTSHFIGDHKNSIIKKIFEYIYKNKNIKDLILADDIEHLDQIVNYTIKESLFNIQLIYILIRKDRNLEILGRIISGGFILNIDDLLNFDLIKAEKKIRSNFQGLFSGTQNIELKYHYDGELKINNIEINNSEAISLVENISKEIDLANNVVIFIKKNERWKHYNAKTIQRSYIAYVSDYLDLTELRSVIFDISNDNINQYISQIKDLSENYIKVFVQSNEQIEKINSTLISKLDLSTKDQLKDTLNVPIIIHDSYNNYSKSIFTIKDNNFESSLFVESILLAKKDWIKDKKHRIIEY